ncbi:copper homeostasis protein CutC [Vibrio salinus]|uniref:copper homeostasis protein CutC n=1 Tax=Vibrio salinus TaxID=2899784 RepID=UPI001E3D2488|nr:copper homeostasis protein CutC [Vibrio salinus]MCE0496230.1 copper homeostasis protein CutC [Vibrio salinus]
MNKVLVEVCVDSIESLNNALVGGADRIELCSSLPLGGVSPSYGLTQYAVKHSEVPVYAMVRLRSGDFLFTADEIAMMCDEIQFFRETGVSGIVIGALTEDANVDVKAVKRWVDSAKGLGITFHRAFDLVNSASPALEQLIDLGCERVLTSGGRSAAFEGIDNLTSLVGQANGRISVMPGCGVNQHNAKAIIDATGAREIHLSAKITHPSKMLTMNNKVSMGTNASSDTNRDITDIQIIRNIVAKLNEK